MRFRQKMENFVHIGQVPQDGCKTGAISINCAAAQPDRGSAIKLWLVDSGCQWDVVCRREFKALAKLIRKARVPIRFDTAMNRNSVPASGR